jgi:hypothetical protein
LDFLGGAAEIELARIGTVVLYQSDGVGVRWN